MNAKKTVAFHTLGCKLNFSETSTLSRMLENEGFEKSDLTDKADVYVINTCSVTENADKECRHLVRRIQRKCPGKPGSDHRLLCPAKTQRNRRHTRVWTWCWALPKNSISPSI